MTMMTVDDLARDLKVKNDDLLRELVTMGYDVQGPESRLETDDPAALRAELINNLPQREVVEKRIKPTVIRRRAKPDAMDTQRKSAHDREQTVENATPTPPESSGETQVGEPIVEARSDRKLVRKARKTEPARIIEPAPRPEPAKPVLRPAPPLPDPAPVTAQTEEVLEEATTPEQAPNIETEATMDAANELQPSLKALDETTETKEAPTAARDRRPRGEERARIIEPAPKRPEPARIIEPAPRGESPVSAEAPRSEGADGGPPNETAEERARRKKRKDRRMQPAQIIGKVDLRREPPREPERPAPTRPSPPPTHARRMEPPQTAPKPIIPEIIVEEDPRKKKKKDVKKGVDERPDRVDDDKSVTKRRKEVVLQNALYNDRARPLRLKGRGKKPKPKKTELTTPKAIKRRIKIPNLVTVANLAHKLSVKAPEVIQSLISMGMAVSINESIDFDTAALLASEFGYEAEPAEQSEVDLMPTQKSDTQADLASRPPVITVMGHVDHGKTSLLDRIRSTHVTDQEAGGITQHIGAHKITVDKGDLVFLDTPGHEAFTAMRARGAQVTDFVVLVVAADDGVMDQTVEAINHAKAAEVPIIVAVNKIDKPEADRDRVLRELSEHGLIPEAWGGDTLFAYVSAKTGEGIPQFLDLILLQAEMMELKANPDKQGAGAVVEARLDKGKGPVATVLVREGALKLGDPFIAGVHYGKVRAMLDGQGNNVTVAGPSTPVEVHGFSGVPEAGETFVVVDDERMARQVVEHRLQKQREQDLSTSGPMSLENLLARMNEQPVKELNLIIKADVQGSVEALRESLEGIAAQEIKVKIIHSGVGAITESDVMLARASRAIIIGFNVRPTPKTSQFADQEHIDIRLYTIIYEVIDDVRKAMEGMLAPIEKETINGRAQVRQVFHVPKFGSVAGSFITSGKIERSNQVRLIRDNTVIYTGRISSMKRFKEDVREAVEGYECGIGLENYRDIKVDDIIEAFTIEHESAKLV